MKKMFLFTVSLLLTLVAQAADPKISFSWDANTKAIESESSFISSDGYFTITELGATETSNRNKEGYTKGIKVKGIEIDMTSFNTGAGFPIESVAFVMQNGSSGNDMTITVSYYDGSAWVEAETKSVAGNTAVKYSPTTIASKANVQKIKFAFTNSSWFLGVEVYENTAGDGAPTLVTEAPVENSNLPGAGVITLQFDELVKKGTGDITLGGATISNVACKGNTVEISYTNFVAATPLVVAADAITDLAGNPLAAPLSISYQIDVTAPTAVSISPTDQSEIHINDLGEEAHKIKITFDEDIKIDETKTITFGNGTTNATVNASVDGKVLTLSYAGLAYESTNTLTIPEGYVKDLSDNACASLAYTFTTGARDAAAPILDEQSTVTTPVHASGSFWFQFNEIVVVANQSATINGESVYLSNNGNVIGVNYTALTHGSSNELTIPAGCITDTVGNAYAGTTLDFTIEAKTAKAFDMIVDVNGSGDYATIQAAIDDISDETKRTLIYVKPGTYKEKLCVWKNNVSLIGENADKVIIAWDECASTSKLQDAYKDITGVKNVGTDASYTMLISGDNFYGENFTVRNDYDYAKGTEANKQAVALEHIKGDKHVLKNVKMYSFQDTYYPKSAEKRQYLTNCYILGGTDFIFGSGTAFIENSKIACYEGGQYITAASDTQKEFGIVISNSEIKYAGLEPIGNKRLFYLGRPWKTPAKTTFANNTFESGLIQDAGWVEWSGNENHKTAIYNEYNSMLIGGGAMSVSSRVAWSSQLTAEAAARVNQDNAFNYGENNVWNALGYTTAPEDILNLVEASGSLSWNESAHAVGYIVFKNGAYLANVTTNSYTDANYEAGDTYEVAAYNEYGATTATTVSQSSSIKNSSVKRGFLKNTLVANTLSLQNAEEIVSVELIAVGGQKVFSTTAITSDIEVSFLQSGFYVAIGKSVNGDVYVDKIVKK